jgi:hypothetical protein
VGESWFGLEWLRGNLVELRFTNAGNMHHKKMFLKHARGLQFKNF